ncbi:hypothetical protein GCM10007301_45810 [Azorhizobium oxalatiphilum]|uniref:Uncharacterized protein n=1 Tax=Azorhizobium oxalatiphilum TaxID=980631 RepID=A0A917FHZ0_9HYPH|nr:hypothetical protein [Azorhizobium oxalatiphilum]GGF80530.1 hypothetical protein GCM10007301_45810 [Azorhizobium oxalatiphilum]
MVGKPEAGGERSTSGQSLIQQAARDLALNERGLLRAAEVNPLPVAVPDLAPIFLVSSFRTSSTWLWQKFRQAPSVVAYYEIFNEHLGYLNSASAANVNYTSWDARHPVSAPYFIEFLPLLKAENGVRGYSHSMAFDSLMPRDGVLTQDERDYVDLLIGAGRAMGKVPLLSCTRMLGRAAALKAEFGGRSVLCVRNLFHQWGSYGGQAAAGNLYFMQTVDWTLKASRHDPFLALVDDFTSERTFAPDDARMFQAFLLLHLHLYACAYEASDFVLDTSLLAADANARHEAEHVLSRWTGAPMDLSDVKESFDYVALKASDRREVCDAMAQFTKMIRAGCGSRAGADFVEGLTDAALAEWERHDFYTGRARSVHGKALDALRGQAEAAEQGRVAVTAERDAQAQAIAQLHSEKNDFAVRVHQLAGVSAERDALATQLAAAQAEAARMEAQVAAAAAEAEARAAREAELTQAVAAAEAQAAEARDAATAHLGQLDAERAAAAAGQAAQAREIEELRAAQASAEAEARRAAEAVQADLTRRIAEGAHERDALAAQLREAQARPTGLIETALAGLRRRKG